MKGWLHRLLNEPQGEERCPYVPPLARLSAERRGTEPDERCTSWRGHRGACMTKNPRTGMDRYWYGINWDSRVPCKASHCVVAGGKAFCADSTCPNFDKEAL